MKSWSQLLHKMLDALAFTNAGHLGALQRMLQEDEARKDLGGDPTPDIQPCASAAKIGQCAEIIQFPHPRERAGRSAA